MFPATKAVPKEMLPIGDKPAIQYIVEEAVASDIRDILIIINERGYATERHFSRLPVLEQKLLLNEKHEHHKIAVDLAELANISFIVQHEQKGLGHAVLQAKDWADGEDVLVMYGDDVILSTYDNCPPCTKQLIDVYNKFKNCKAVLGIKEVPQKDIHKYSSLKVEPLHGTVYSVSDMIEKPKKGEEFSCFSILGRCLLKAEIFDILEHTPYGAGGELQLTDAIKQFLQPSSISVVGVDFEGKRFDIGSREGLLQANIFVSEK
jgi:UTP--glucose-1-phosphate uridylyltransferase